MVELKEVKNNNTSTKNEILACTVPFGTKDWLKKNNILSRKLVREALKDIKCPLVK